ncbi:MAG: hypothetical protein WD555_02750 [Fulvivirga sp.]
MRRIICVAVMLTGLVGAPLVKAQVTSPIQKSDSITKRFAGLHFDFHATMEDKEIGDTFTFQMIDSLLSIAKPDFIQVDGKGHPGISSYPTSVGNRPESFSKDILKIWREATKKHDIPLYVHYSGLWDDRALALNPAWGRINADGKYDENVVSIGSPYLEELMIPQLKELATLYGLDGAWIDGDNWRLGPDYSPAITETFTKETGISSIPREITDPHFFQWAEFNRKIFRDYITKYINAAHEADPGFKITSNWSFSSMMPEPVDVPVDFLSGDVAGTNSLYSSAFESRCLALQGKQWDLMSWSFAWKNNMKATKSVAQLKQEAAEVLAMGGGFQTYWQQNRDGSPEPHLFSHMAEIIRFSQERKEYSYESEIIPQIGLLYSTYSWKRAPTTGLYTAHSQEALKGSLNMLLDSQLPVEILMDHHLPGRMDQYLVIILPEWDNIDPAIHIQLVEYVNKGGNLIIVGAKAVKDFANPLGVQLIGDLQRDNLFFAGFNNKTLRLTSDFQPVQALTGTEILGSQLNADDFRFEGDNPLATIRNYGKGKIAGVYFDIGNFYRNYKNPFLPILLKVAIEAMEVDLISSVEGSSNVHQVISQKNNKMYIHLINTSGPHDNPNVMVYDEVPPIRDLKITVQLPEAPTKIKLQPENVSLPFNYENGNAVIRLPELKIHSIIEIQE